jgi:predicted AAA+ superfamily ATPase
MKRYIEKQLSDWKRSAHRKPLIVRGARQVGKTWSIEYLGASEFDDTIKIDF